MRTLRSLLFAAIALLTLSCTSQPKVASLESQLSAANARAGKLQDQLATLKSDDSQKISQVDMLTAKLAEAQKTNASLTQSIDALKSGETKTDAEYLSQITALNKEKADLQSTIADLQKEKAAADAMIQSSQKSLDDRITQLENLFAAEIKSGDIAIRRYRDILIVSVKESVFFVPDWPTMLPGGEALLQKLAPVFKEAADKIIRVEGNTAVAVSSPESLKYYPTSWHLGAARAAAVVSYLQKSCGMDPMQLVATSFGEYRPIASNSTEAGMKENRRVDFILVNQDMWNLSTLAPVVN